jgi:choline dehydrogenase-like flavoprotein
VELSNVERVTLRLLADTIVPRTGNTWEPLGASASDLGVDGLAAQAIQEYQPPDVQRRFRQLLKAVDSPAINLLLVGRAVRFRELSPEDREAYVINWARSRLGVKRRGFHSIKRLIAFLYYSVLTDDGRNRNWPALAYPPPDDGDKERRRTPPDLLLIPMAVDRETTIETDLAVIGSGAGGAVIAATVAKAGHRVLVIEAGSLHTPETFPQRELPGTESMFERRGLITSKDFAFSVLQGRTAGGGTVVNWMTCLRPPRFTLEEWERAHGIPGIAGPAFRAHLDEVWARLGVNTEEAVITPTSEALQRGCEALGYQRGVDFHITPKNAKGCGNRCDYCSFGCVYSAKQSTLVTYLPDAQRAGAKFLFDTEARTVLLKEGAVAGVEAVHHRDGKEIPVKVKAHAVVLAAGAIHTPAILLRSGIRDPAVGHGIRFDPTTAVGGVYDRPIRMWAGVPQTLHIDRWLTLNGNHGFWLETVPAHPGLTALGFPWRSGRDHKEVMRNYARIAANIVLVRDRSAGRVTIDREGNPVIAYKMVRGDRGTMMRGIVESARIHVAAGAQGVWSLHTEPCEIPVRPGRIAPAEFDAFAARVARLGIRPNALALFTAHAMGSVPMGASSRRPTKPTGELRGVRNLFIGDASALPSAVGVNPMITIMAMARRTADFVLQSLRLEF